MSARTLAVPARGGRRWLAAYRRMLAWEFAELRGYLPMLAAVLVLQGVGFVLGIALFFRHIPEVAALYVATGVPVVNLVTVGLVFEPQVVADQRAKGSYDFLQSLPVPRSVSATAWYTVCLVTALPAVVAALAVALARYHLHLTAHASLVPAVLVTCATGVLLGYAIAHGVHHPMVTRLVAVSSVFLIFGFCPVLFPGSALPGWLEELNRFLPFGSMATIVRGALTTGLVGDLGRAYAVVGVWGLVSGAVAARAVTRRG